MLYASTIHIKTKVSIYQNNKKKSQQIKKNQKKSQNLRFWFAVFLCFDLFCLFLNYVFVVNLF